MIQHSLSHIFRALAVSCAILSPSILLAQSAGSSTGVRVSDDGKKVRIEIGGKLFSEYHYHDVTRPFLFPIIGPGDAPMSRNWPIVKDVEGEAKDHPHHRSLWYAHGAMNGHDFWAEGAKSGKTLHEKFLELKSGQDKGVIRSANKLIAVDGTIVCTGEQTITIHNRTADRIIDYDVTFHASNGDLTFGDTKEGSMAIRVAETMRLKGEKGKAGLGHIVNSEGVRDDATWGKRAKWCDYYGPVQGKTLGVAIFDHPENPRYPTWWHVRDYGLFAANPFGIHDFDRLPDKTKGNLTIPGGKSVTFRYRFYFHEGDEKQGQIEKQYQNYVETVRSAKKN